MFWRMRHCVHFKAFRPGVETGEFYFPSNAFTLASSDL